MSPKAFHTFSLPHFCAEVCVFFLPSCCAHPVSVWMFPSGSLVAESVPGNQPGGFQGIPHQLSHPGPPSGSAHSFALGAPHDTLTQLQMQVDKLTPQGGWQPRPPPPPRSWYQSVRLQPTVPGPPRGGGSPSLQPARRLTGPPPNRVSPTSSLASPEFTPQVSVRVSL